MTWHIEVEPALSRCLTVVEYPPHYSLQAEICIHDAYDILREAYRVTGGRSPYPAPPWVCQHDDLATLVRVAALVVRGYPATAIVAGPCSRESDGGRSLARAST